MSQNIPVFSVVGYSGSGKTTLLEKLVPQLRSRGFRVAVVKHDAHEFDIDQEGKDSWRMTRAGAEVTVIASHSHAAIMENRPIALDELISRISEVDIILTEGYSQTRYPKIGVLRKAGGKPLPEIDGRFFALVTDMVPETLAPVFGLNDTQGLAEHIISNLKV